MSKTTKSVTEEGRRSQPREINMFMTETDIKRGDIIVKASNSTIVEGMATLLDIADLR